MLLFSTEHDRDLAPRPLDEDRGREVAGPGLRSAARPCTRNRVIRPRPVKLSSCQLAAVTTPTLSMLNILFIRRLFSWETPFQ